MIPVIVLDRHVDRKLLLLADKVDGHAIQVFDLNPSLNLVLVDVEDFVRRDHQEPVLGPLILIDFLDFVGKQHVFCKGKIRRQN